MKTQANARAITRAATAPKARLVNIDTNEVSMVDVAANLRRWVICKSDKQGSKKAMTAKAMAMPSTARQSIMDGLAQVLDQLTGIASTVGEAEVDDAATVPPELVQAVGQCAEMLNGIVAQFAPAAEAPAGEAPPVEGAAPPATPPVEDAAKEICQHCGQKVDAAKSEELAKAGRKIKGTRLAQLKTMSDSLAAMIKELEGEKDEEDPAAKSVQKNAGVDDETKKVIDELRDTVSKQSSTIEKAMKQIEDLRREPGASNARPIEGAATPGSSIVWPSDMSASIAKRKAQTAKK